MKRLTGFPILPGIAEAGKEPDKKKEPRKKSVDGGAITLEELAAQHDVSPEAARAFLREAMKSLLGEE